MIDTDLIDLKILHSSHIVFKDLDSISKLQEENKTMKNIFVLGFIIIGIILICSFSNNEREKED